jgi:3-methylfumaryl-CoA hydratase
MAVTRTEVLATQAAAAYRDTFAPTVPEPGPGEQLPPGWEGLYFPFDTPFPQLRPDGSPAVDGVLPEFGLPRRMYAGEDTVFHRPLRFGDEVGRTTRLGEVARKEGRRGRLVFADVVREHRVGGELAIESTWHDVFLEKSTGDEPPRAHAAPDVEPDWREQVELDSRHLFRFSALTFNTHRIHYDRDWAREVEGLDDLLVHGPLTRMLLLDAAVRHAPDARPAAYTFRALAPVLVDTPFTVAGHDEDGVTEVFALDGQGGLLARGRVAWQVRPTP